MLNFCERVLFWSTMSVCEFEASKKCNSFMYQQAPPPPPPPSTTKKQNTQEAIVLVDLNEYPSIFQKVQHSYSRHQKTTSNLLRINLKGIVKFNEIWPLEGATCMYMYITLHGRIFGGITKLLVLGNFLRKLMVSDKMIHRAFRTHTTLK